MKDVLQIHAYTTDANLIERLKEEAHRRRIGTSALVIALIRQGLDGDKPPPSSEAL